MSYGGLIGRFGNAPMRYCPDCDGSGIVEAPTRPVILDDIEIEMMEEADAPASA